MKSELKKVQKKLWKECRRIVFNRDKNEDGTIDCFTCPARDLIGRNCQLGHGPWPESVLSAFLKYDLRVLHYQCSRCNLWNGGMGAEYYKRALEKYGKKWMKKLEKDKQKSVKAIDHYKKLLEEYSKL